MTLHPVEDVELDPGDALTRVIGRTIGQGIKELPNTKLDAVPAGAPRRSTSVSRRDGSVILMPKPLVLLLREAISGELESNHRVLPDRTTSIGGGP